MSDEASGHSLQASIPGLQSQSRRGEVATPKRFQGEKQRLPYPVQEADGLRQSWSQGLWPLNPCSKACPRETRQTLA